tara:strand:+ start:239 stop:661 length:423 start_codon:yes stop_codon:yes gene_type:complete
MNRLPNEIQNIIYKQYWIWKYNDVINELNQCYIIENKIKNFLYRYCFREALFQSKYLYYLILFNNDIKSVIKNKNLKYICNINKLTLYYCFDEKYKNNICSSIHENLKYITMFSISCSGQMRYAILNQFHQLSLKIKNKI